MSNIAFQVGDVVRLKSGSPEMTVDFFGVQIGEKTPTVRCRWFHKSDAKEETFSPAALEKVSIKQKRASGLADGY